MLITINGNGHGVSTTSASSRDVMHIVLGALSSAGLRHRLATFHEAHRTHFTRHNGGDFPLELSALHAQYGSIVSSHVGRRLAQRGITWGEAAAACERAALSGRCSSLRLRLLTRLSAVSDLPTFFELFQEASPAWLEGSAKSSGTEIDEGDEDGSDADGSSHCGHDASAAATLPQEHPVSSLSARVAARSHRERRLSRTLELPRIFYEGSVTHAAAVNGAGAPQQPATPDTPPALPVEEELTTNDPPSRSSAADDYAAAATVPSTAIASRRSSCGASVQERWAAMVSAEGAQTPPLMQTIGGAGSSSGAPVTSHGSVGSGVTIPESGEESGSALGEMDSAQSVLLTGRVEFSGGRIVEGRWTRSRKLGVGSSGVVYLVRDEVLMYEFAAKLVVPRNAEAASRLEMEMALMRKLRHPHICAYLGSAYGSGGCERYILLEVCSGGSVRQLLDEEHPTGLGHARLCDYGMQLLRGLHFLHEHLVIHRDLKADNLLLDASRSNVKIADFGSANELVAGATMTADVATIRGSPYWMSPEHIAGARCGRKADVWSYACVLLEMLTGRPPWQGPEGAPSGPFVVFVLLDRIVRAEGPPPMPAAEAMPDGLHELLLACFERDLERRPTTTELLPRFELVVVGVV